MYCDLANFYSALHSTRYSKHIQILLLQPLQEYANLMAFKVSRGALHFVGVPEYLHFHARLFHENYFPRKQLIFRMLREFEFLRLRSRCGVGSLLLCIASRLAVRIITELQRRGKYYASFSLGVSI